MPLADATLSGLENFFLPSVAAGRPNAILPAGVEVYVK
jgi:hypothetical protein